jgi:aldehyde dehydrogenase family 7 protein A1
LWKAADSCGLVAVACTKIVASVLERNGYAGAITSLIQGRGDVIGEALINDPKMELVSFTGSTNVGRRVSEVVGKRFGKKILELGGNNAMIVLSDADQQLALRACLFSAVGTAGQRNNTNNTITLPMLLFTQPLLSFSYYMIVRLHHFASFIHSRRYLRCLLRKISKSISFS